MDKLKTTFYSLSLRVVKLNVEWIVYAEITGTGIDSLVKVQATGTTKKAAVNRAVRLAFDVATRKATQPLLPGV